MAYPSNAIHGCPHKQKLAIAIASHIHVPSLFTYDDEIIQNDTHEKRRKKVSDVIVTNQKSLVLHFRTTVHPISLLSFAV
jgi:hypothetical protein